MRASRLRTLACVLVPLGATLVVFLPASRTYFLGDDFVHLIEVVNLGLGEVLWRPYMGHLYALPTFNYWVLWTWFGPEPRWFYSAVLLIHLFNVGLYFVVARHLTRSDGLASLGALLWGTSLYHEGSLGWFCVHGHVLAGTALLLILCGLVGREKSDSGIGWRITLFWAVLLLLAATGFGTALGLCLGIPFVVFLYHRRRLSTGASAILAGVPVAAAILYVSAHLAYANTPGPRPEPALLESVLNPLPMVATFAHLFGFGLAGLAAGFFWFPLPYGQTAPYLLVALVMLLLLAASFESEKCRRWILTLLILAGAAYAAVAIGRAEARDIFNLAPSLLVQNYRYHYVSSIALGLAVTLGMMPLVPANAAVARSLYVASVVLVLWAFSRSDWSLNLHSESREATQRVLQEATAAAESVPPGAIAYVQDRPFGRRTIWNEGFTSAGVFTLFRAKPHLRGREIRYIVDPRWPPLAAPEDSRLSRLVVSKDSVPTAPPLQTKGR